MRNTIICSARGVSRIMAAAVVLTLSLSASGFAQETVRVVFRLQASNVTEATAVVTATAADNGGECSATSVNVRHRATETSRDSIAISFGASSVLNGRARLNAPAMVRYNRGSVSVNLNAPQYQNAEVSLHAVNGRRVMHGKASAANGTLNISRRNIAAGAYLLSVKGTDGSTFATKVAHVGGKFNINMTFGGARPSLGKYAALDDCGTWTLTVNEPRYEPYSQVLDLSAATNGRIDLGNIVLTQLPPPPPCEGDECPEGGPYTPCKANEPCEIFDPPTERANFMETVGNQSIEMLYVAGGTFTFGHADCNGTASTGDCQPYGGNANSFNPRVTLSPYFISKAHVSDNLWRAVMGSGAKSMSDMDWYDAFTFTCKLSQMTGKNYRMQTEAEFEYVAKGCAGSGISLTRSDEEWAYNSWLGCRQGGTDPIGDWSGWCTQKTRRNADDYLGGGTVRGRLIRSIEGIGPKLRLVVSADKDFPAGYIPSCNLKHPVSQNATTPNSWRDPRWVTGGDMRWETGAIGIGSVTLHVWEDGTARSGSGSSAVNGQWFTSNNMTFVFVPSSGTRSVYKYIFQDPRQVAIISDQEANYMGGGGGFVGRIAKQPLNSPVTKPTVSGLTTGEALAKAQSDYNDFFVMYDFANLPDAAKKKDDRLIEPAGSGWFQDNTSAGGIHNYRKDVDANTFRFAVIQSGLGTTILATGSWFTVNNTFLRVTSSSGYVADYLYALTPGGTFYHNSYMGYEPGDFRMFEQKSNSSSFPETCPSACSQELTGNSIASMYETGAWATRGRSTFVPPPMP